MGRKQSGKWSLFEVTSAGERRCLGSWEVGSGPALTLGRSRGTDVVFGEDDVSLSRRQLTIAPSSTGWKIRNVGSAVLLRERDGKRIRRGETVKSRIGDAFRVSETRLEIHAEVAPPAYCLEVHLHGKLMCRNRLTDKRLTIGALPAPVNDVAVAADGVSRKQHLAITPKADGCFLLEDLQGRNGVFLKKKDSSQSERIEKTEIREGDVFSFGLAVGAVRRMQPERRARTSRIFVLTAAMLLISAVLVLLRGNQDDEISPPPPSALERVGKIWHNVETTDRLIGEIETLLNATGQEFKQRANTQCLLNALKHEQEIRNQTKRLRQALSSLSEKIKSSPWMPSVYDTLPPGDDAGISRQIRDYADIIAELPQTADDLSIPAPSLLQRIHPSVTNDWNKVRNDRLRLNPSIIQCRDLLLKWQRRRWYPPPSETELEHWRVHCSLIDGELYRETEAQLREYIFQIAEIEKYWVGVDAWLVESLSEYPMQKDFPEWPLVSGHEQSAGPLARLSDYTYTASRIEIVALLNQLDVKATVFNRYPILLRMAERIPSRWPAQSVPHITQAYEREIDKFARAIHSELSAANSDDVNIYLAKNALGNLAGVLPRLETESLENVPTKLAPSSGQFARAVRDLRGFTLTVAERIYASAVIATESERNRLKAFVREMMEYAYMCDDPSRRKQALLDWAQE